ncbi:hypothetical protein DRO54_04865 [Candidatus Bathyarchaeota archaeon]|nr:MAG: hypothetical protein DRO54_04865 [Candidatus Bathyarchaeota archaeon]
MAGTLPEYPRFVFGAHAAGKTTFVASANVPTNIGSRSFSATYPFVWEATYRIPGLYEVAPMLPGAVQLFDPYTKESAVPEIDFTKLAIPPRTYTFLHIEPSFDEHLRRYINRDGKRIGLSEKQATQALARFRLYYRNISQTLTKHGISVSRVCLT